LVKLEKVKKNKKKLISKPGKAPPILCIPFAPPHYCGGGAGRKHSEYTKLLISKRMSKYSGGVGLYDLNNNLLYSFNNHVEELAPKIFKNI
jgi:hypothetical protein